MKEDAMDNVILDAGMRCVFVDAAANTIDRCRQFIFSDN